MKLGGLFSGIGGFELAWTRLGGEVAWMCEWDKNARKVLEARFPGVPIYPDVRDLDPAEVEAVDVLTGGSPCQGFSVAGQRQGLLHGESRLFADYVRIMDGLAARGLQYALWENVPGVLSITNPDGERTFPHVIGALAGGSAAVRLDPRRKWNVGLVADGGRAVAWRVLDSRYFGVAQRRRRVFACVAFGDSAADRAGRALLAVAEGVRGDSAASGEARQGAAGGVAAGARDARAFNWQSGGDARGLNLTDQPTALSTTQTPAALISQAFDEMNFTTDDDTHHVLRAGTKQSTGVLEPYGFSAGNSQHARSMGEEQGVAPPIRAGSSGTNQSPTVGPTQYGVRRLTPIECERLQAFPDGWTEPAGSDSARYKALGNAVTVNTVGWILRRVLSVEGITTASTNDTPYGSKVDVAAMLNFQGSKGNSITNDGDESFALNAMHGHDVHVVAVDVP